MNWNHDPLSMDDEAYDRYLQRYGFNYLYQGCAPNVFEELEGGISPYPEMLVFGYGTGFTRSNPWEKYDAEETYNIQALVDDIASIDPGNYAAEDEFREYMSREIRARNDITVGEEISGEEFVNTHFKMRNFSPGRFMTFMNEFTYAVSPLATFYLQSIVRDP